MNALTKSKRMDANKFFGALVAVAVLGLSLGDALTGHGVKGNKNLNQIIVGTGSSSTSTGSGEAGTKVSFSENKECTFTVDGKTYKGVFYDCTSGSHSCTTACVEKKN